MADATTGHPMRTSEISIDVAGGRVGALLDRPESPRLVYVMAHGAGGGMRQPFLAGFAHALVKRGVAVLRYNFPYMEAGRGRVDPPAVAHGAVRAAVASAASHFPGVRLIAGGKSFGGRMTSGAQAEAAMPGMKGLAFLGFPLHPPEKPGVSRAEHLAGVTIPMLFLQGTRDEFARLDLLEGVVASLGGRATLSLTPDGDHSFKVRKSAGKTPAEVEGDLCDTLLAWALALS